MAKGIVYLMRGLPSCGKSHTARLLAGENGVVCETDAFFLTEVGDDPTRYDYRRDRLSEARRWAYGRFMEALETGVPRVVVDRGNGLSPDTQVFARAAVDHGYAVELAEPQSPWWQEIRVLLKYKRYTRPVLYEWSEALAVLSRQTHRVPASNIRRRMAGWKHDLTVAEILSLDPGRAAVRPRRGSVRPTDPAQPKSIMAMSSEMGSLVLGGQAAVPRTPAPDGMSRADRREEAPRSPGSDDGRDMWVFDETSGGFGLVSEGEAWDGGGVPGGIDIDDDAGEEFIVIEDHEQADGTAEERRGEVEWHANAASAPLPTGLRRR